MVWWFYFWCLDLIIGLFLWVRFVLVLLVCACLDCWLDCLRCGGFRFGLFLVIRVIVDVSCCRSVCVVVCLGGC